MGGANGKKAAKPNPLLKCVGRLLVLPFAILVRPTLHYRIPSKGPNPHAPSNTARVPSNRQTIEPSNHTGGRVDRVGSFGDARGVHKHLLLLSGRWGAVVNL